MAENQTPREVEIEGNTLRIKEGNFAIEVQFNDNLSVTNDLEDLRVKAKYDTNVKKVRALIRTDEPPDDPSLEPFLTIEFGGFYIELTIYFSTTEITMKQLFPQFLPDLILEDVSKIIAGNLSVKEFVNAIMKMMQLVTNNVTEYFTKRE